MPRGKPEKRGTVPRFRDRRSDIDLTTILLFVAGLGLLIVGAELLVRGASRLAAALGIPPLVIGLTVVAFGTSAPELAVSIGSAFSGGNAADIALGNVLGSNTANILLILGLSAVIAPLVVSRALVRRDVPIMIGVTLLLLLLALDGKIGRVDGLLLAAGAITYTVLTIRKGRAEVKAAPPDPTPAPRSRGAAGIAIDGAMVVGGLAMLVLGADWFVTAAVSTARVLGVSELVIGLTVVALGTSLPELVTSVLAALRGHRDLAVGNVIGSNLFNILVVLGITATVSPEGIRVPPAALRFDLPVVIGASIACLPIFFTGWRISRIEGAIFLGGYGAYVAVLFLAAAGHPALAGLRMAMLAFVLPLTVLTLLVTAWRRRK